MKLLLAAATLGVASAQIVLEGDATGAVGNTNDASFSVAGGDANSIDAAGDYSIALGQGAEVEHANAFVFAGTSDDGAGGKPSQGANTATFWVDDIYLGDRALGEELTTNSNLITAINALVGAVLATASSNVDDIADLQAADVVTDAAVSAIAADVVTNAGDIATNAADIATNVAGIAANSVLITANANDVATNAGDILTNTGDIATNTGNIATNAGDIATNTGDIATNAGDIATNAGDIATNAGDIATAQTDIGNLDTRVTAAESDIATLQADVATAQADIATGTAERATLQTNIDAVQTNVDAVQTNLDDAESTLNSLIIDNGVDIQANAEAVAEVLLTTATLTTAINNAEADIITNAADIATNAGGVSTNAANIAVNSADIATLMAEIVALRAEFDEHVATTTTTEAPTTDLPSTEEVTLAEYAALDGQCSNDYCVIPTVAGCQAAAQALGLPDTGAGVKNLLNKVAGCYTTGGGALVFNENLASAVVHNTGNGQSVICELCDSRRGLRGFF